MDVLLVEDNPGDVRLIREAFSTLERGTALEIVTRGDEAVELLTQQATDDSLPDIALLDLNLPGRDGCGILETIRDDPRLQYLPVVILTSSEAEEDIARCYDANANAYVTKPTDPTAFRAVAEAVERFWFETAQLPPIPA